MYATSGEHTMEKKNHKLKSWNIGVELMEDGVLMGFKSTRPLQIPNPFYFIVHFQKFCSLQIARNFDQRTFDNLQNPWNISTWLTLASTYILRPVVPGGATPWARATKNVKKPPESNLWVM